MDDWFLKLKSFVFICAFFNITISEGEKKYIYSHLVANTQLNDLVDNDNKIKELVEELLRSLKQNG